MIKFEDVENVSVEEYFNGNQFSIDIFNKKYAQENENYSKCIKRVCDYIASCETTGELKKYWSERWFDEIYNDWWHPAGSIIQGANSGRNISMSNCTTISLGGQSDTNWDNLESIIKNTAYTVAKTAAYRQGLGVDFSKLRPRGLEVRNSSNESQGVVHWMKLIDSIGNYIGQKGRIPAMLFSLSVDHPDVEEFIKVKSDFTVIQNANISVQTNNAFYKAVEDDADWELSFNVPEYKSGEKIYVDVHSVDMECEKDEHGYFRISKKNRPAEKIVKFVKARKLLELIAKNMLNGGEPGIQQIDMARYWSNSDYVYDPNDSYNSKILSSNACSEQYLSRESLCVLASINVGKFSTNPKEYKESLKTIAYSVNRFLDNVNTMEIVGNTYATPHQKLAIEKLRRTGAGVTNVAGWLFKQNLEYGSEESNNAMFEFNKTYNYYLYESSINLGKEKGSFGLFVKEKYEQSPFIQEMMKQGLVFDAMRNVTCSSIAPTGCIEENTRIATSQGLIKIKDIIKNHPEEKQFSYDVPDIFAANEHGNSKISAFYNNGTVNGYAIELEDGREIKVSDTHRIRILKDGKYDWEYAPNLKVGDVAILAKNVAIDVNKYVELNDNLQSNHFNCSDFKYPKLLNEQLAEFIGLFTGDGSIKFRSENHKTDAVRFPVFSEDIDLIEYITNSINDMFGITTRCIKRKSNMFELTAHSINLCNFLISNGFEKKKSISPKTYTKEHVYHIPEYIFKSPKSVICAYLRGFFEADGCISKGHIELSSKYHHIVQEAQELLTYVGIQSFIVITKRNEYDGSFSDNPIYRLSIRYKNDRIEFKNKIHFLSNRKNKILDDTINFIDREKIFISFTDIKRYQKQLSKKIGTKNKLYNKLSMFISKNKVDNNLCFINRDTIKELSNYMDINLPFNIDNYFNLKIKNIKREQIKTFDIEILNNEHTYITSNGIINHNTLSLMFRDFVMSYGTEPGFGMYFWKRTRVSGKYEYYFCIPNVVRQFFKDAGYEIPVNSDCIKDTWDGKIGKPIADFIDEIAPKIGIKFKKATEVNAFDKLDLMSKLMKYVDSSISVTYTLPENASWQDVYNLILEANKKGVKSIAAFPDKKMYGIISDIPFKTLAFNLKSLGVEIYRINFSEEELKELNIVSESKKVIDSPKRHKELESDLYQVKVRGKKYIMSVGIQDGAPYEMFGGAIPDSILTKIPKKGKMIKIKNGHYKLELGSETIDDFGSLFTGEEQILFRMISTGLRHGIPIKFLVDQLSKSAEDVADLTSAASRVLKKYIINGEKAGGKCPNCEGQELIYIDGCVSCTCGWSKGCG